MSDNVRRVAAVLIALCSVSGCALGRRSLCETIAAGMSRNDATVVSATREALASVVQEGRVVDSCATKAAFEATRQLKLRDNIPLLRQIAELSYSGVEPQTDRQILEDSIAEALHTLSLFDDPEATVLARRLLGGPVSIVSTAVMTLTFRRDWDSTTAVALRLAAEDDPRHFSFVWQALEFLSKSPQVPTDGCGALARAGVLQNSLPPASQDDSIVKRVGELRNQLAKRYGCVH